MSHQQMPYIKDAIELPFSQTCVPVKEVKESEIQFPFEKLENIPYFNSFDQKIKYPS